MLTRAPDPLPATHRGHMLSHSSSNTTDSSQISYLCMCVLYVHSVCLRGGERRVCVCVKGMHSFWLVRAEPAASSQRVYSAMFLSLSLSLLDSCIHTHPCTHTHTWKNTHGANQCALWLGLMTSGTTKGLSAFLFGRRSAASLINSHRKSLKAKKSTLIGQQQLKRFPKPGSNQVLIINTMPRVITLFFSGFFSFSFPAVFVTKPSIFENAPDGFRKTKQNKPRVADVKL